MIFLRIITIFGYLSSAFVLSFRKKELFFLRFFLAKTLLLLLFFPFVVLVFIKKRFYLKHLSFVEIAIVSLGPSFIKIAQILVNRVDFFDQTPFSVSEKIMHKCNIDCLKKIKRQIPEECLNKTTNLQVTSHSGSVCQILKCNRKSDSLPIALKVVKTDVKRVFEADFFILKLLTFFFSMFGPIRQINKIITSIKHEVDAELDMVSEASKIEITRSNNGSSKFFFPEILWELTSKNCMAYAWIECDSVFKKDRFSQKQRTLLCHDLLLFFLKNSIVHGIFHADLHQGNMVVSKKKQIFIVDFGFVGTISVEERFKMFVIILLVTNGRCNLAAQFSKKFHYFPVNIKTELLEIEFSKLYYKTISNSKNITTRSTIVEIFKTIKRFGCDVDDGVVVFQKGFLVLEGFISKTVPDFNVCKSLTSASVEILNEMLKDVRTLSILEGVLTKKLINTIRRILGQ